MDRLYTMDECEDIFARLRDGGEEVEDLLALLGPDFDLDRAADDPEYRRAEFATIARS